MSTVLETEALPTLADLLDRLGGIAPGRVMLEPPPGTATETDLLGLMRSRPRLFELIEGTVVEKAMGFRESSLAAWIIRILGRYLDQHDIGELSGADGLMRLMPGLVRIPDVAFIRRERFVGGVVPPEAIPDLVPDLAVEVLSESNTPAEMERKLKEYFLAGTSMVWLVDPRTRTIEVYTSPDAKRTLNAGDVLEGGAVLPGFAVPVQRVFERFPNADGLKE